MLDGASGIRESSRGGRDDDSTEHHPDHTDHDTENTAKKRVGHEVSVSDRETRDKGEVHRLVQTQVFEVRDQQTTNNEQSEQTGENSANVRDVMEE